MLTNNLKPHIMKPTKTPECSKVLQLMDKGYDYQFALKIIVIEYAINGEGVKALEIELNKYI